MHPNYPGWTRRNEHYLSPFQLNPGVGGDGWASTLGPVPDQMPSMASSRPDRIAFSKAR
jgi:hypothetical protein